MNKKGEQEYDHSSIEKKWQEQWEKSKLFSPDLKNAKNPYYSLMMFPYPSAEGLHVGNMYAFTGADVHGRFMRMQGKDVFEPIGLDGFGIHSENYAIKVGKHPKKQAEISQKNFYRQLRLIGNSFDWTATLETYDPDYYRWTQWLFIQMFKKGLAYRKKAKVNWCPSDKTVLADEQVIDGKCERDGAVVEKRDVEQWFFKITDYADRLLAGLDKIDWPEKIKIAQREWIGRSEGTRIEFKIQNSKFKIEVFTTRPETIDGATFLVLSPKHPKAKEFKTKDVVDYIKLLAGRTDEERRKEKTGVFTGEYVVNPLTKKKIPIWISDYVLMDYGTGAIMAVPAEDARDREFAEKYKIPIEKTSLTAEPAGKSIVNYHLRDWLISRQRYWGPPIPMIYCPECAKNGLSWFTQNQKTMGISNFQFPISNENLKLKIKNSEEWNSSGWYPVPEEDLPVLLPDVEDWRPLGTGVSPLANHPEFYETKCPNCGSSAKRETDVSDTFLDSAWYYLRYLSVGNKILNIKDKIEEETKKPDTENSDRYPYDIENVKKWCPASIYIGGAEHSVLHLLYVRFVAQVLSDLRDQLQLPFQEPFPRFFAHGLIIKDGAKMSKSRGNVVVPDTYIEKYGADTLRLYLMFLGPFKDGGDFRDTGIEGMHRFVRRVWKLLSEYSENSANQKVRKSDISESQKDRYSESSEFSGRLRMMHKTIKAVTSDIEQFSYNTAIARLMEWYNAISKSNPPAGGQISKIEVETFLKLLAPFAPHFTEELYQSSEFKSIHLSEWPKWDEKYLVEETLKIVIQENVKVRDVIEISKEDVENEKLVIKRAEESEKVKKALTGKTIKKTIYIKGKVVNFVTS